MKIKFSILLLFLSFLSQAQNRNKYWLFLHDDYTLESVTDSLNKLNIPIENKSLWLNAVTCKLNPADSVIFSKPYFKAHQVVKELKCTQSLPSQQTDEYLDVLKGIKASAIKSAGLTGKGVKVGIIDAGYQRADSNEYFQHLFKNNHIKATKDFVNPEKEDFYAREYKGDSHGREVWKRIGGYSKKKHLITGLATEADYYLARTENADVEKRIEEDNWVAAIEWMDSLGVRLVNTSLGYASMFDDSTENYSIAEMNGETAVISIAAKKAIIEKNMIIISSAGNEGGNKNWRIVTAPSDVDEIIAIGAVQPKTREKANYSSIGPEYNAYTKPDIVCESATGTSFAAPVITGLVACILEKAPPLKYDSVKHILYESAHLYPFSNNYIGYGIPDCKKIIHILEGRTLEHHTDKISVSSDRFKTNLNQVEDNIIVYHKLSKNVIYDTFSINTDSLIRLSKKYKLKKRRHSNKLIIRKPKGVKYSTIDANGKIIEIEWLD